MDFSDVIKALNQASAFELYRMRAAIDRVLAQPHWLDSIRSRLRVGQTISYFDPQANTACAAQIIELRRKHALVLESATQKRWLIAYAAINVDGADVEIREQPRQGLGRNEVAVGEVVGFIGRDQQQRSGKIPKSVCTCLPAIARLTVDKCTPTASATSTVTSCEVAVS